MHARYEMVDSQRASNEIASLAIIMSNKLEWNNYFVKLY